MKLQKEANEIIKMFSFYVITEQVMKLTKGNKKTSPQYLFYDNKFLLYYYKSNCLAPDLFRYTFLKFIFI